ncbi:MAG: hypothetical protein COX65_06655 [Elusimicrobia bacterium CG_4_10_14_0_2_um_filter_56_8]|nr:MAG: hypothetical protein AUJ51_13735 [Elusimicrobia bacterium CG1_02_56_21]PJA13760.1 MAG: hypothetical protein COX65_06655 [Elusimicrobia bacterium CG_4_10_14_0_2_um_filter_56_8]
MKPTKHQGAWALIFFLSLAVAGAFCPSPVFCQANTRAEEQSFDYNPDAGETPKIQQFAAETTYEDAVLVNHPIYGAIMFSKYRWKSWVTRSLYLTLINIALIAVMLSLSKNEEYNLIVAYVLSGASFALSIWTFFCAILIMMLHSNAWVYVLPISAATCGAGYIVLMKIKKSDISLTELKESFKKMGAASNEDLRLVSVQGTPGDWPDQDFIKYQ